MSKESANHVETEFFRENSVSIARFLNKLMYKDCVACDRVIFHKHSDIERISPMIIVDTHCHAGLNKYEPVETLLYHMEQSGVDRAVLIQHQGTTDNSYHVECLGAHPDRPCLGDDCGKHRRRGADAVLGGPRARGDPPRRRFTSGNV